MARDEDDRASRGDGVSDGQPTVVILAGPNGAGKSSSAPRLLQGALEVSTFVNADVIARDLSPSDVDQAALAAGRIMLARLRELADRRASFAFETTLATRSFAPWLGSLARSGYGVHLFYLWLASPELAIERVAYRVRSGGHNVPPETIRRRYDAGLRNFFSLYRPLVTGWAVYDNTDGYPRLVAERLERGPQRVYDKQVWEQISRRGER
jgi:predicted ABC-type ATPase